MSESTKKKFYQTDGFRMFMGKYGIGVILIFMILVIGVMKPRFLYPSNILNVLTQISVNCLIAYGMCLCITTGGIDLSVGPQLALVSVLLGQFIVVRGMNIGLSVVLAVLAATVFGFVNGFLVAKFDMAAFVVTLATQLVIRSIAQIISDGQGMSMASPAFKNIYSGTLAGIPYPIIYMVVASIIMYIVMHWTKFGRYVFAVGGNVNAAIASGVNVFWTKTLCYTISGLLAVLQVLSSQVRPVLHSPISVLLTRLTQLQPAYLVVLLSQVVLQPLLVYSLVQSSSDVFTMV